MRCSAENTGGEAAERRQMATFVGADRDTFVPQARPSIHSAAQIAVALTVDAGQQLESNLAIHPGRSAFAGQVFRIVARIRHYVEGEDA